MALGWCIVCRKVRQVRVTRPWLTRIPQGVCRQCDDGKQ